MKNKTTFQELFNELPLDMISQHPIEADFASAETINRVWNTTSNACKLSRKANRAWRMKRLLPAVAALLAVLVVTAVAAPHFLFTPNYSFHPPTIAVEPIVPLVEQYEHAVNVNVMTEHDGVRVTLDKYVLDTVDGSIRFLIHFETTDGTPLTELSAERMSQIVRSRFKETALTSSDFDDANVLSKDNTYTGSGNHLITRRSDAGNDPCRATFECRYYYNKGDGDALIGKTFTLAMTDYRDEVQVTKDLGFTYKSMAAIYNDAIPASDGDYIQGSERVAWADGTYDYYYALKETRQKLRFSTEFKDAYIDNIGFRTDLSRDYDSELYVSFVGLSTQDKLPALIDTRNGVVHYGIRDTKNYSDRITLIYSEITPDDLPYLFMMQEQDFEQITRASGTWELTFTAEEALPVRRFDVDTNLTYHEYDYHVTRVEITDTSLYFDGKYTVRPQPEDVTTYGSIYGTIDLVMRDGTIMKNPFYQGPSAGNIYTESGTTRWGGEFLHFIDSSQVVAVIALGETIPLE